MAFPDPVLTLVAAVDGPTVTFTVSGGKTPGTYAVATGDGGSVEVVLDDEGNGISDAYTYTMPGEATYTASVTVPTAAGADWPDWTAVAAAYATWADVPAAVATWGAFTLDAETATTDVAVTVPDDGGQWPLPRLTLTAVVSDTDTGHNLATFTLANAKSTGITVDLDPGDGTTTVDMAIGADGTATGEKTYTHTGRWVYTASVTVPMEARYATWADVPAAVATWGALVADTATWGDLYATSETATCEVEVVVGNGAIWATAVNTVSPPYVQIDTWSGKPEDITEWTVTRYCPNSPALDNVMIYRGTSYSGSFALEDVEAPWGTPVYYVWRVTYADGTSESFTSNTVVLTGPSGFGGCWITDPASGATMRITIQEWTELERAARQSVLSVMNRPDPVVLSDLHLWPSSELVLITRSEYELVQARSILFGSRIILVRSWTGSSIEAAYLAVGDVTEARIYAYDPSAWHRSLTVDAQEVRPVPATADELRASWLDLYTAYPTWTAVDADFPSWADVIAWNPDTAVYGGPYPRSLAEVPA